MNNRTRATVGWTLTVAAALMMVFGVVGVEVGLVVGTTGFLMLASAPHTAGATRQKRS